MIVMLEFECWRASSNHDVRWLKVSRLQSERAQQVRSAKQAGPSALRQKDEPAGPDCLPAP